MGIWSMNIPTNELTIGTTNYRGILVKDGNTYSRFNLKIDYADSNFIANTEIYITDGTTETQLISGTELILTTPINTSTNTIYYLIKNTLGSSFTVPVFDQQGRPLIIEITYR